MDLNPIKSTRVVVAAERSNECWKLCQLMFLRDGSLTVSFPYFQEAPCQLAIGTMPPASFVPTLRLDRNVRASSHRVKYTHHVDGRAHFSQDGRIRTIVKRQAVPLTRSAGHLFTLSVQGLSAFKRLPAEQQHPTSKSRTNAIFSMSGAPTDSLKVLGRIYDRKSFLNTLENPRPPVGPVMMLAGPDGRRHQGFIMSGPSAEDRILLVSAEPIPPLNEGRPAIVFVGGFDPLEIIHDYRRTSDFLFMASPAGDLDRLIAEHGTVDFVQPASV